MFDNFFRIFDKVSNRFLGFIIIFLFIVGIFFYLSFIYFPDKIEKEAILNKELSGSGVKKIELVKVDSQENKLENSNNTVSSQDKINDIKEKMDYYKIIDLGTNKFYFNLVDNILSLTLNSKIIGEFGVVRESDIKIENIYSSNNDFFISIGNNKYLYNKNIDLLEKIDLHVNILYVKKSQNIFIFVTEVGSYLYDVKTKKLEYFTFFEDFIFYNDSYIGIIKKDDNRRINNLGINTLSKNSIYFYNPKSKEKKSLYETDLNLEKIYMENDEIYFIDSKKDIYKLENLE